MTEPWTRFRNLCRYYADCVKYSEQSQEYLFSNQLGISFMMPRLPYNWHVMDLACIVGGVVAAHGQKIVKSGAVIFAAVLAHNTLGYVLGYAAGILARFSNSKCRTVSIEVGMQNAGLATVLSVKHFPSMPEAAIASAVSCVWHSISGALLAGVFNLLDVLRERRWS